MHNIIVGKLWIDNHGEMDIVNHTTGEKCHLIYKPYSYFSREVPRRVSFVEAKIRISQIIHFFRGFVAFHLPTNKLLPVRQAIITEFREKVLKTSNVASYTSLIC